MSDARDTWVALMHRPADPSVVGAVLADRAGEGMTVLCLPGPDRLEEATRLATEEAVSVASGRPWLVVMYA